MGQAKKHRESIFKRSGGLCVFCGGVKAATTIDHMPPRNMFDGKDRPAGLEFAACAPCNNGAGRTDLVCALIGRIYPDSRDPAALAELQGYLRAVKNNVPGLLEEMQPHAARAKLGAQRLGLSVGEGGLLSIGGPIATAHMEAFGARMGLAMHFERTGQIVPPEGAVFVRIYSNVELFEDKVPREIFEILPESATLEQGRKTVGSQFRFGVEVTVEGSMTMSFTSFRQSFAILTITTVDLSALSDGAIPEGARAFRPGALQVAPPRSFSAGTLIRSR
jgi:hypothetical protein